MNKISKAIVLASLSIALFSSCNEKDGATQKNFYGTWSLTEIESAEASSKSNNDSFLDEAMSKSELADGLKVSIFSDGKYARFGGKTPYEAGFWKPNEESKLGLALNNSERLRLVKKDTSYVLHLTKQNKRYIFKLEGSALGNDKDDPFYPTNNIWRGKVDASDTAIKVKVDNYVKHVSLILKSALERKAEVVDFSYSKGIVKIYNGGIGIISKDRVPEEWTNSFENEAAADKAYQYFEDVLASGSYKGGSTGDWIEDDYNILLSIYAKMKTNKN